MSTDGKNSVTKYSLDPATAQRAKEGDSQVAQHASTSVEQSRLAASHDKELQVRAQLCTHLYKNEPRISKNSC